MGVGLYAMIDEKRGMCFCLSRVKESCMILMRCTIILRGTDFNITYLFVESTRFNEYRKRAR